MAFYEGRRQCYDGALCTVRYHGPLSGLKGEWLGVEWDNPARGKHNGQHKGEQIFKCLSSSPTAASFIRSTRKPDPKRTVLEAIKHKYASSSHVNGEAGAKRQDPIEISGKTVEEVGFEKIQNQISRLADLKVVLVDDLNVSGVAKDQSQVQQAQAELADVCPNVIELDVGWNAIETWWQVSHICASLKHLQILKASGLRFTSCDAALLSDGTSPFNPIAELHLSECLLKPDQILHLLSSSGKPLFPSLKTLWLSRNELGSFHANHPALRFNSIITLYLENNRFSSLEPLPTIFTHFPNTTHLSLQGNLISTTSTRIPTLHFPSVVFLNLADNHISTFAFIDALPSLFPNLTSLRISKNPLYDQANTSTANGTISDPSQPKLPSDSTYYLILARIPSLKILNYTIITTRDREEGEIYYLSVAEKHIRSAFSSSSTQTAIDLVHQRYPLYATLCSKYDRPNILDSPPPAYTPTTAQSSSQTYAPGTLGARLVTTTFYIPETITPQGPSSSPSTTPFPSKSKNPPCRLTRPLPPSMSVNTLKSILSRHFGLPPLQFRLVYETGELDPVHETTTKLGGGREGWEEWGDWDVDVKPSKPSSSTTAGTEGGDEDSGDEAGRRKSEDADDRDEGEEEKWVDGFLLKDGVRWRKREIEILDGMRGWGDYLENDVKEAKVRVEPFNEKWEEEMERWKREDLWDVIGKEKKVDVKQEKS